MSLWKYICICNYFIACVKANIYLFIYLINSNLGHIQQIFGMKQAESNGLFKFELPMDTCNLIECNFFPPNRNKSLFGLLKTNKYRNLALYYYYYY